ncbi:MAG TPA: M23 family metallopeptidase [Stellaceae bacterium]|nr:M23 family metallopeptidase [Stellaceae bacterium]
MRRFLFALVAVLPIAVPAYAGTLTLDGPIEQGGLIRGKVDPGASVSLDGAPVRVAPDGHFILGFARDAPDHAALDVVYRDGSKEHRDLSVTARQYDTRNITGLPEDQVSPGPELLDRIKRENGEAAAARNIDSNLLFFETRFIWPVTGPISGVYGSQTILNGQPRAPHMGVDIAAPPGTPIKAPAAGTVTLAEKDFFMTGGTVMIDHGYGLSTVYFHMSRLDVRLGQKVAQGQIIGAVGATGRATGPHLHWGLNWYQLRLDPALVVGPMPVSSPASDGAAKTTAPGAGAPGVQPPH